MMRRVVTSAVLALAMTAGVVAHPAAAQEVEPDSSVSFEVEAGSDAEVGADVEVDVEVDVEDGSATATVDDPAGVEAEVVVAFGADVESVETLNLETIQINALVDGQQIVETLLVEDFALVEAADFTSTLRVASTGQVLHLDTTVVQAQALPVLYVLGILARFGIKHVITWIGRTQLKSAVKSYLLNSVSAAKWSHILAAKHNWHLLGARSREQVADLMGRAMAYGSHSTYGSAMKSVWRHNGRTITVTYDGASGKVSNGWVN